MSQGNLRSYFTYRLSNVKVISFENINNNFEDLGLDTPLSRPLPFSPLLVPPAMLPPKFLKHCWATSTPNAQLFKGSSIVWHPRSWNLHPNGFCEPPSCPSSPHEPPWFTRPVPRKVAQLALALKPQRSPFVPVLWLQGSESHWSPDPTARGLAHSLTGPPEHTLSFTQGHQLGKFSATSLL